MEMYRFRGSDNIRKWLMKIKFSSCYGQMMTFFLTLKDSVKFVVKSFSLTGEVFVPKMYSLKIEDLAFP